MLQRKLKDLRIRSKNAERETRTARMVIFQCKSDRQSMLNANSRPMARDNSRNSKCTWDTHKYASWIELEV